MSAVTPQAPRNGFDNVLDNLKKGTYHSSDDLESAVSKAKKDIKKVRNYEWKKTALSLFASAAMFATSYYTDNIGQRVQSQYEKTELSSPEKVELYESKNNMELTRNIAGGLGLLFLGFGIYYMHKNNVERPGKQAKIARRSVNRFYLKQHQINNSSPDTYR